MEERRIERKPRIPDTRIHCLIYFIAPSGHRYAFIIKLREEITNKNDKITFIFSDVFLVLYTFLASKL